MSRSRVATPAGRASTWSVRIRRCASDRVLSNQNTRSDGNGGALATRPLMRASDSDSRCDEQEPTRPVRPAAYKKRGGLRQLRLTPGSCSQPASGPAAMLHVLPGSFSFLRLAAQLSRHGRLPLLFLYPRIRAFLFPPSLLVAITPPRVLIQLFQLPSPAWSQSSRI